MRNKLDNLKKIIKKTTNKNINIDKSFEENKLDSLDIMTVAMEMEKKLAIKISDKKIIKMKKPKDLLVFFK